jgi:hypothetical protein
MKFGKRIRGEANELWEDYYVDYKVALANSSKFF